MATALPILDIQEPGTDLAKKTVFIKVHLGLLGNSRKVSSSQVEVDADKALILVQKACSTRRSSKPSGRSMVTSAATSTTRACRSRWAFISCRWGCWRRWMKSCASSARSAAC